jgi:hypothetical protein
MEVAGVHLRDRLGRRKVQLLAAGQAQLFQHRLLDQGVREVVAARLLP